MLARLNALFMHAGIRRVLLALRLPLALVVMALLLYRIEPRWLWAGLAVSMVGEFIQLWCFANLHKRAVVACNGPYALVRNPMYLGRFLIGFGGLMLLDMWPVLAAYTVVYVLYMFNRVRREEEYLKPVLGEAYLAYCASVGRFVPGLPYRGQPVLTWDWSLFHRNHGGWNLLATLVFWAVAVAVVHWPK